MIEQCYTQIGLAELFEVPVTALLSWMVQESQEAMVIKDTPWREW